MHQPEQRSNPLLLIQRSAFDFDAWILYFIYVFIPLLGVAVRGLFVHSGFLEVSPVAWQP